MKLFITTYTEKLMQMTNDELQKEFSKAVNRDPKESDYEARCIAIENEYRRRGITI